RLCAFCLHAPLSLALLPPPTLAAREYVTSPRHFRRNFDFGLRLYFTGGRDSLQNRSARRFLRRHWDRLLALPSDDQNDDQDQRCDSRAQKNPAPAPKAALLGSITCEWGSGQGLMHGRLAFGREIISL